MTADARKTYYLTIVSLLAFLVLLLLTTVDVRRGFLFPGYFTVGAPSVLFNFTLWHLPMFLAGVTGVGLSYTCLRRLERKLPSDGVSLKTIAFAVAIAIGLFLVIDLFMYRGVPTSRFLVAGKMGAGAGTMGMGWAFPVGSLPIWLQPLGEGVNYLLVVWHATVLSMFIGGLFLVAGAPITLRLKGNNFGAHLLGAALALPQPFCSCCAAPVGSTLYRKGAGMGPLLAFSVTSPMLNITGLILVASFLPAQFVLLRIAGGIVLGILVTYAISLAAKTPATGNASPSRPGWAIRPFDAFNRLFGFEKLVPQGAMDTPGSLLSGWLKTTGRLARVMVPVLLAGAILATYIARAMPAYGNNWLSVAVTSFFATLMMVPTWTEIPLAAVLVNGGVGGIAATLLITLPAVSIPSLAVIIGATGNVKAPVILGLSVFLAGIVAGMIFL